MKPLRIVMLTPPVEPEALPDRADTFVQAAEISECLATLGHRPAALTFGVDRSETAARLAALAPDLVVNLVEDVPEGAEHVHIVTALLDGLSLRYTGAPTTALASLGDKPAMKRQLAAAGLPIPADLEQEKAPSPGADAPTSPPKGEVKRATVAPHPHLSPGGEVGPKDQVRAPSCTAPSDAAYIIKSATEHASIGLDETSVVQGATAAQALLARRRADGGRWFAEQFIDGREFNVSLLEAQGGPLALPVAEILFLDHVARPRIVGYAEKWAEDSAAYATTPRSFPRDPASEPLRGKLTHLALTAWNAFGLRGYARVDFRIDAAGNPYILEVNANPCLARDAGFCAAAAEARLSQADIVARVIESALA